MNRDPHEMREVLTKITAAMGDPEMGEDIASGRTDSDFVGPLLAGMLSEAAEHVFAPLVGATFEHFDPTVRPMVAMVTLMDGSRLRITVESLEKP